MTNLEKIRQSSEFREEIEEAFLIPMEDIESKMHDINKLVNGLATLIPCYGLPCEDFCNKFKESDVCQVTLYYWLNQESEG